MSIVSGKVVIERYSTDLINNLSIGQILSNFAILLPELAYVAGISSQTVNLIQKHALQLKHT